MLVRFSLNSKYICSEKYANLYMRKKNFALIDYKNVTMTTYFTKND